MGERNLETYEFEPHFAVIAKTKNELIKKISKKSSKAKRISDYHLATIISIRK